MKLDRADSEASASVCEVDPGGNLFEPHFNLRWRQERMPPLLSSTLRWGDKTMGCVNPDGTITASAASMLDAMKSASTPEQIAQMTGLPLFRIRSGLRELVEAKMVTEREGYYQLLTKSSKV